MGREGDSNAADDNPTIPQLSTFGFTGAGYYYYDNGGLVNQSSYGSYWSRTTNGKASAYGLRFFSTYLSPRNSYHRGFGLSLRCLAR